MEYSLSPRRIHIMNRIGAWGINPSPYELNRMIEIILSFHPSDEAIEDNLKIVRENILKGSVRNLPGFTHKVFCQPIIKQGLRGS